VQFENCQAHLKKWIEVASSPQKLGQARVVGQVLPNVRVKLFVFFHHLFDAIN